MTTNTAKEQLMEIATRIKELREIMGFSVEEMTEKTNVTEETGISSSFLKRTHSQKKYLPCISVTDGDQLFLKSSSTKKTKAFLS